MPAPPRMRTPLLPDRLTPERALIFRITHRHARLATAEFFGDVADLDRIDWKILQNRDFSRDNNDLGKMERYQAETLVHRHLPIDSLLAIACYNSTERDRVDALIQGAGL